MMRILLADHHPSPLWALNTTLNQEPGIEVVGAAEDGDKVLNLAKELSPDLILMDIHLPGKPIESLIAALHALENKPLIIVMSSDSADGRKALRAEADAFVSKAEQPDWLLNSLRKYASSTPKKEKKSITNP